jgi:high-affinity iron transporter
LLGARDSTLLAQVEAAMGELRARIGRGGAVDEVRSQALVIGGLFDRTEHALAPDRASAASSLVGAFTILLREGLEALLLVVAMIGFLRKADRADALPFVHAGWVAALAAGLLTWGAATYAIEVSGASRELTEGFGSLLAALVLLSVGLWMHGKSHADAWRRCVREKMSRALSRRSAWFVFLLSFVVVYREAFETILFYAALWSQGNGAAVLAGTGLALATLAAIAWAMLRFGQRLPIERFFAYTSMLMAALAVVMVGKGIAALQEVGLVAAWLLPAVPRVDLFGLHPTVQGTLGQAAMLAAVVAGCQYSRRAAAHLGSRGKSG